MQSQLGRSAGETGETADVTIRILRKHAFIANFRLGTLKNLKSQLEKSFSIGYVMSSSGGQY